MIEIKSYDGNHKEEILDMILKIQNEEFDFSVTRNEKIDIKNIPQFYQQGQGDFFLALDSGKVVGTLGVSDLKNNQAALRRMYVEKKYRGQEKNVAQLLLEKVKKMAVQKGLKSIYLGTAEEFTASHRFYERNGFCKIERIELPETFPITKMCSIFYHLTL